MNENQIKNIIILWTKRLNLQRGGVHRIIYILMNHLPKYGYQVKYVYTEDVYQTFYVYDEVLDNEQCIPLEGMRQYLLESKCDLLIGQDGVFFSRLSELVAAWHIEGMKYVTEYHNSVLLMELTFSRHYWKWLASLNSTPLKDKVLARMRLLFYPLWLRRCRQGVRDNFLANYKVADAIVFLSKYELDEVAKLTDVELSRCKVINNPLSWEKIEDTGILEKKEKKILIVSRLYNPEKRLDRALRIWKILEERGHKDWQLVIVGAGKHEEYLKAMTKNLRLQSVRFEGRQDAAPYYQTASLFMLTSAVEGWGLTLTESMQTGVVPLAFDSYPALQSIITDGYDGCIIEDDNLVAYADRMEYLMTHKEERERIARNGLESCKRFTIDKIVAQWVDMINGL